MARVTQRVSVKRAKSTNYNPMGPWDSTIQYRLSDMGIPLVTLEKSTVTGFAAYGLNVDKSTIGVSPDSTAGAQEWRLLESTDFLYMVQAYIEKLQAQVITAEYIEALNIRTGNLEVLDGSKLGGFSIRNNRFISKDEKIEIDGDTGQIILRDPNSEDVRTIIRPVNLPTTPASYFGSSSAQTASLSGLAGSLSYGNTTKRTVHVKTIAAGDTSTYKLEMPSINLSATASSSGPSGGMEHRTSSQVVIYMYQDGVKRFSLDSVTAVGNDTRSRTTQPTSFNFSGAGVWTIGVELVVTMPPLNTGWIGTGSGNVSDTSKNVSITLVTNRSEIGSNGMVIATSASDYTFMVGDLYQVRRGNIGFQITNAGIKKSSNMNNSSPTWDRL